MHRQRCRRRWAQGLGNQECTYFYFIFQAIFPPKVTESPICNTILRFISTEECMTVGHFDVLWNTLKNELSFFLSICLPIFVPTTRSLLLLFSFFYFFPLLYCAHSFLSTASSSRCLFVDVCLVWRHSTHEGLALRSRRYCADPGRSWR